jgi:benzoyl-CoA reductase/2-hydroxyglutaryl-CoA dehydratase subunit BcrC/BadD/HgdB
MGKKSTITDIMDSPALAELKATFKKAALESGAPPELVEEFMVTGVPKVLDVIDKVVTVDTIALVCMVALMAKGYKPFYGNYGGQSNVACVSDPYLGTPHSFSSAILTELDNWYQRTVDGMRKRTDTSKKEDQSVS